MEQFGEIFPALVRTDSAPVVEEADVLLLPNSPSRSVEELGEVANGRAAERTNGATAPRIVPRPQANPRPGRMPDPRKVSMFESLWPKGGRGGRDAQVAVAQAPAPPQVMLAPVPPPAQPEQHAEPMQAAQPAPVQHQVPPTLVSILKSGVVDGMAYTLYSDGSIEAQLPQGTLRFGSITELRNHIEHSS